MNNTVAYSKIDYSLDRNEQLEENIRMIEEI
jgi:hypothetical protein